MRYLKDVTTYRHIYRSPSRSDLRTADIGLHDVHTTDSAHRHTLQCQTRCLFLYRLCIKHQYVILCTKRKYHVLYRFQVWTYSRTLSPGWWCYSNHKDLAFRPGCSRHTMHMYEYLLNRYSNHKGLGFRSGFSSHSICVYDYLSYSYSNHKGQRFRSECRLY